MTPIAMPCAPLRDVIGCNRDSTRRSQTESAPSPSIPTTRKAIMALADALIVYGKPEAAIRAAQKAMRLDPTGKDLYSYDVGFAYVEMGRYEDAIPILKQSPDGISQHNNVTSFLIIAYVELGRDRGSASRSGGGHANEPAVHFGVGTARRGTKPETSGLGTTCARPGLK